MTTTISPRRVNEGVARTAALCLLALAAVLLHSSEARAQWTTSGANTTTTNNVGIGTASPATGKLVISGTAGQTGLDMSSTDQYAEMRVIRNSLNAGDKDLFLQWQAGAGSKIHFFSNNAETMTLNGGSVGIGTANPSRLLELSASSTNTLLTSPSAVALSLFNTNNTTANNTADLTFRTLDAAGNAITPAKVVAVFTNRTAGASSGDLGFVTLNAGVGAERMRLTSTGNVGIGTPTPGVLNGIDYTANIPLHIQRQSGGTTAVVVDTNAPSSGFVINDSSQVVDNRIWSLSQGAGGGKLTFATYTDAGAPTNRVVIDRAGNMGIGTTAPTSRLHVAGDITVDGNINAKYQDVAEWVRSAQKLSAGTVVVVDAKGSNQVLASAAAYDTSVAGVVSAQPGLTLGEAGEGKALVATTGRVKVKVDATRAPIRAGDLLVTSDTPGVAMRSVPVELGGVSIHRPGTIIGKALEPLEKGTGEILVLLSLQ